MIINSTHIVSAMFRIDPEHIKIIDDDCPKMFSSLYDTYDHPFHHIGNHKRMYSLCANNSNRCTVIFGRCTNPYPKSVRIIRATSKKSIIQNNVHTLRVTKNINGVHPNIKTLWINNSIAAGFNIAQQYPNLQNIYFNGKSYKFCNHKVILSQNMRRIFVGPSADIKNVDMRVI